MTLLLNKISDIQADLQDILTGISETKNSTDISEIQNNLTEIESKVNEVNDKLTVLSETVQISYEVTNHGYLYSNGISSAISELHSTLSEKISDLSNKIASVGDNLSASLVGERPDGDTWLPSNGSLAEITNDMLIQQEFYSECFNVLNVDSGNKSFNDCAVSFTDVDPNNTGLSDFNIAVNHRKRKWGI